MTLLKRFISTIFILLGLSASIQASTITPTQLQKQQQEQHALVIDVRSGEEFADGHLQSAVNIPHDQIAAQISTITTDKDQPIYVYCRSGRRSELAKAELEKLGYRNVTNIGAYSQLKAAGFN